MATYSTIPPQEPLVQKPKGRSMKALVIAGAAAAVFMLGALAGATAMSSVTISKQTNFVQTDDNPVFGQFYCDLSNADLYSH